LLSADCGKNQVCDRNQCTNACTSNAQCPTDRPVCQTMGGYCVGCVTDADCKDPMNPHCDQTFSSCFP
jgi:hypothetical protein